MSGKKVKYILLACIVVLVVYIVYDSGSQPNVNDLKGGFKEVATYRNENNTGPIVRIYAVTVKDAPWDEIKKYGDLMPYTKYGTTQVFFFSEDKPFPVQVIPGAVNFDRSFNPNCLAVYEKDANGQISLNKNPFSNSPL